ncbi:hypothetical protein ACR79T_16050, partial [Sphingobacterium spiritivorum]|uniref:hypothetical protein n=1 Tax=Sphingobacterium spiritivorum TaxID=258 RepID=UPI003DA4113A
SLTYQLLVTLHDYFFKELRASTLVSASISTRHCARFDLVFSFVSEGTAKVEIFFKTPKYL